MWTDGSRVGFTRWARREPNNRRNEDCTEINFRSTYIISLLPDFELSVSMDTYVVFLLLFIRLS